MQKALKDSKITSITIKSPKASTFTVKSGKYLKKKLVVQSPKAVIKNSGNFKSIEVQDCRSFGESGKDNNIAIKDKNSLKVTTDKKCKGASITVASTGKSIKLVNNGNVKAVNVKGNTSVVAIQSAVKTNLVLNAEGKGCFKSGSRRICCYTWK